MYCRHLGPKLGNSASLSQIAFGNSVASLGSEMELEPPRSMVTTIAVGVAAQNGRRGVLSSSFRNTTTQAAHSICPLADNGCCDGKQQSGRDLWRNVRDFQRNLLGTLPRYLPKSRVQNLFGTSFLPRNGFLPGSTEVRSYLNQIDIHGWQANSFAA